VPILSKIAHKHKVLGTIPLPGEKSVNMLRLNLALAALILALAGNPVWAKGGHGGWHGGGHHHHHWGAAIGLLIGVPLLVNALRPPVVYREPVYVERPVYVEPPPRTAPGYRRYCPSSRLYYPEARSCDRAWLRVVPDDDTPPY
jgi:hypothetical protein